MVEELALGQGHLFTTKIFDSKADPTKLDSVELLDLVIKLAFRILERSHNEPETVDRFFFSIRIAMFDVEALYS